MENKIDWEKLADQVSIEIFKVHPNDTGMMFGVSSEHGEAALILLIGEENLQAAVDYYINYSMLPAAHLARMVLRRLHPLCAMQRCYEIYHSQADIETRHSAVELLREVADKRVLNWVNEFLDDADETIQTWGISMIDKLLSSGLLEIEEANELLKKAENHPSKGVQHMLALIKHYADNKAQMDLEDDEMFDNRTKIRVVVSELLKHADPDIQSWAKITLSRMPEYD